MADNELIYEEPTPAGNSQTGGKLYQNLEQLAADGKGEWARVWTCDSRSGANSIAHAIKVGKRKIPPGEFEFTCRADSKTQTSKLYARYVGPTRNEGDDVSRGTTRSRKQ